MLASLPQQAGQLEQYLPVIEFEYPCCQQCQAAGEVPEIGFVTTRQHISIKSKDRQETFSTCCSRLRMLWALQTLQVSANVDILLVQVHVCAVLIPKASRGVLQFLVIVRACFY